MTSRNAQWPALRALSPEDRRRVLEQGMRSAEYQKGYTLSERLGWGYILATIGVVVSLLTHRHILVLCFLPIAAILGILRIRTKRKLLRMLEQLAAEQLPPSPADDPK